MSKSKNRISIDTVAGECIAVRLRMLNRIVTNIYDDLLRPFDLKISQMNLLVATAKIGTVRPAMVSTYLNIDVSTLSRNIERMKARGWLESVADEDARAQPVRLTEKGKNLLQAALPAWKKAQDRVAELLGQEFVANLDEAAQKLRKLES